MPQTPCPCAMLLWSVCPPSSRLHGLSSEGVQNPLKNKLPPVLKALLMSALVHRCHAFRTTTLAVHKALQTTAPDLRSVCTVTKNKAPTRKAHRASGGSFAQLGVVQGTLWLLAGVLTWRKVRWPRFGWSVCFPPSPPPAKLNENVKAFDCAP